MKEEMNMILKSMVGDISMGQIPITSSASTDEEYGKDDVEAYASIH